MVNTIKEKKSRVWNINFFLLWQGQLVSAIGDVVYELALGFWILAVTGSTALMGALMAASAIPRVILSPFAGVWVDRLDRKRILILADLFRCFVIVLVGLAALFGVAKIWMVFAAGIVIGFGSAFFSPAVNSIIPDIVSKDNVVKANSYFQMTNTSANILGSSAGGFLYAFLGAPLLFLMNGISYIFSSITEVFISVPKIHYPEGKKHFFEDMREGLKFTWSIKGLRFLFFMSALLNFFAFIGIILILPLFHKSDSLGPSKYGIVMSMLTGGMFLGLLFMASANITREKRFLVFSIALILMSVSWMLFPLFNSLPLMIIFILVGGFFNSVVNTLINSVLQLTIPQNMRGKVIGFLNTLAQGLIPIAMAVGGILGEYFPIKIVISLSFAIIGVLCLPLIFSRELKTFINSD